MGAITGLKKVEVVANVASGSVGKDAPAEVAKILAEYGLAPHVWTPEPQDLITCLRAAIDAAPDLLILLAGDGTARTAAELAGPDGPVIAPLAGGTVNVLPRAIYGERPWQAALSIALDHGFERPIGGGTVDGHSFLVAAILGPPALWAPAREAARSGQLKLAWMRAQRALRRAFTGRLRYTLDGGQRLKAEAVVFMCPLTSRVLNNDESALESAALDVQDVAAAFRLGFHALTGDWRDAPGVDTERCQLARIWSAHGIPAMLDGESVRLKTLAEVRYTRNVARILAIPKDV